MIIKNNAEFGVELALAVPYAYWLHNNGLLKTVITSVGMKPFYYFCDDVREEFTTRTIDNEAAGLNELPNNWIHHNAPATIGKPYDQCSNEEQAVANGWLDYSKWELPNYKKIYGTHGNQRPKVFITNIYNHVDKSDNRHYHHFTIEGLYYIFELLKEKGYDVIYKRENNKSTGITVDQNEQTAANHNAELLANVEGIGMITDYELCNYYDNVTNFYDLLDKSKDDYNTTQLKIMSNCDKFISVCGGNGILSSCFGGDVILYVTQGRELRPGYFDRNSYFRKLSGANIIPIFDPISNIKQRGNHDFTELLSTIKNVF
jgi:hypothetical protein